MMGCYLVVLFLSLFFSVFLCMSLSIFLTLPVMRPLKFSSFFRIFGYNAKESEATCLIWHLRLWMNTDRRRIDIFKSCEG